MGCSNGCATIARKPSGRVVPVAGSEVTCALLAPQGFSAWFEFEGPVGHMIINRRPAMRSLDSRLFLACRKQDWSCAEPDASASVV